MAKIDKALAASPVLSDEQVAEVKRLRDEGERLHETGGHSQSMDTLPVPTLREAMDMNKNGLVAAVATISGANKANAARAVDGAIAESW